MRNIRLGDTGLFVSPLALGAMNYGLEKLPAAQAAQQMETYMAAGGNLLDTAQVYSNWVPGEVSRSEKVIGQFMRSCGLREQVYLCTKGGHPILDGRMVPRLHPQELLDDLHKSLDNLATDHIDLYLLHRDDPSIPVDEILDFFEEQKARGVIRHYGCSNWTLARVREARSAAIRKQIAGFTVNQIWWSLARINPDRGGDPTLVSMSEDFLAFHEQTGMAAMAYSSQAQGYFSKKLSGAPLTERLNRLYNNPENQVIQQKIADICADMKVFPTTIALAWILHHAFPAIPVVSCNTPWQLREAMTLFDEELLDAITPAIASL